MSFGSLIGSIIGTANPATAPASIAQSAQKIISLFKLDPNIKAQLQAQLTAENIDEDKAQLAASLAQAQGQLAIDQQEAASTNWFVAGWRPAVGWVCVAGLAYDLILAPFATFVLASFHWAPKGIALPALNSAEISALLIPLLGIGTLRTVEKTQNAEGNR